MTEKADTSVRYFHSNMPGAPVLQAGHGHMTALLDACLVDGFNTTVPDSFEVADGVATVTFSGGNPYHLSSVVRVSGASDPDANEDWKVKTSTATQITFDCPALPDGAITGALVTYAPLGWEKLLESGHERGYRATDPESLRPVLWVDDAVNNRVANVRAYEGVENGELYNPFPRPGQQSMSVWHKHGSRGASGNTWILVGDGLIFYLVVLSANVGETLTFPTAIYCFGEISSFMAGDIGCAAFCSGANASATEPGTGYLGFVFTNSSSPSLYFSLSLDAQERAVSGYVIGHRPHSTGSGTHPIGASAYPATGPSSMGVVAPLLAVSEGSFVRGVWPGVLQPFMGTSEWLSVIEGVSFNGRDINIIGAPSYGITGGYGRILFDVTGPWR